jgi:predicted lipid-binding transport protein (Tim44 family)
MRRRKMTTNDQENAAEKTQTASERPQNPDVAPPSPVPQAKPAQSSWAEATRMGVIAGAICGVLMWLLGGSQQGQMIAFAVTFLPTVGIIKPMGKKAFSVVMFFIGALVVRGVLTATSH